MESLKRASIVILVSAVAGYGVAFGYLQLLGTWSAHGAAKALFYSAGVVLLVLPVMTWRAIRTPGKAQRSLQTALVTVLAAFVFVYVVAFVAFNSVGQ
jgi:hypothetical protein